MKTYCLFIAMFMLTWNCLFGEIKNGYGAEIKGIRESLRSLNTLLTEDPNLTLFQKAEIKNKINKLLDYITYFELTEELLVQFKTIAPSLYNEIDSIRDRTGQAVTIYVKFVSEKEMQQGAAGTTNITHLENDKNVYESEYGPNSVSIKIASVKKALLLLAHEFGHVKHQVPNLASYIEFYSASYQNGTFNSKYIGHNSNDPSGQKAIEYENRFRSSQQLFVKTPTTKMENPLALLGTIRKSVAKTVF